MIAGTILIYAVSRSDADLINQRRTSGDSIQGRLKRNPPEWPTGAQAHVGDPAKEGDLLPMLVTRVDDDHVVSGQVFLNGSDTYWIAAVQIVVDGPPAPGEAITIPDLQSLSVSADARTSRGR